VKRSLLFTALILWSFSPSEAQYIAEVMEYKPAPGQLINEPPWGTPGGVRSLEGGLQGTASLGAFGGYVVFRFQQAVENDPMNPYGVDFSIFGNPVPGWSEPGVVWVMKDENLNGGADDTWYELAGSDYWFSSTKKGYGVTYTNPGGDQAMDVPWEDQSGGRGVIQANAAHTQPYYPQHDSFPSIGADRYTLEGTCLTDLVTEDVTGIISSPRAFGYADNRLPGSPPYTLPDNPYTDVAEHSGGDAFDIGWAVDSEGNYVELDRIHFVKVQSGVLAHGGWLGELSTEVTGAVDVAPDPSISGETERVAVADLPSLLETDRYQLEAKVFQNGRIQPDRKVEWTVSRAGAAVSEDNLLQLTEEGPLTLTAALPDRPEVRATVSTTVQWKHTSLWDERAGNTRALLYPNPASDFFRVTGIPSGLLVLYDSSGKVLMRVEPYQEGHAVDIRSSPPGVYLVRLERSGSIHWFKLIKNGYAR
jgi:hypothetical protein